MTAIKMAFQSSNVASPISEHGSHHQSDNYDGHQVKRDFVYRMIFNTHQGQMDLLNGLF